MRRRLQDKTAWHRWYAWHPVQVSEGGVTWVIWFEWVERREIEAEAIYGVVPFWQYRTPKHGECT